MEKGMDTTVETYGIYHYTFPMRKDQSEKITLSWDVENGLKWKTP